MDFNKLDEIFDSFNKRPKRTILIICIMALLASFTVYLNSYFGELGKKAASDSGAEKKQTTGISIGEIKTGDQGSVIVGDQVTITYNGVSQAVVNDLQRSLNLKDKELARLLKTMDEKDVALEDRETKLQELAKKYKELEGRLAQRSAEDEFVAQAKQKLQEGDLEGAEKFLLQSLDNNLKAIFENKKAAAADAFELGSVKELQLDYTGAEKFYEQAIQLEPDNTEYLNSFGLILYKLGQFKEAIDYFEKALAIDMKVFGDQHPNVAIRYNNLGEAWRQLGEYQKAIDYFEKALAIDLKVLWRPAPQCCHPIQQPRRGLETIRRIPKSHRLL
jgi:tetratricopeptide (TPR) repeat protein